MQYQGAAMSPSHALQPSSSATIGRNSTSLQFIALSLSDFERLDCIEASLRYMSSTVEPELSSSKDAGLGTVMASLYQPPDVVTAIKRYRCRGSSRAVSDTLGPAEVGADRTFALSARPC